MVKPKVTSDPIVGMWPVAVKETNPKVVTIKTKCHYLDNPRLATKRWILQTSRRWDLKAQRHLRAARRWFIRLRSLHKSYPTPKQMIKYQAALIQRQALLKRQKLAARLDSRCLFLPTQCR